MLYNSYWYLSEMKGDDIMRYIYPACFYPEENGQYSVIFNDLDDIATYGNDLDDAINMATDLLCTWVLEVKKDKKELPKASNPKDVKLLYEDGFVNLIVADIDTYTAKRKKSVKKTLTIPEWLNEMAEKENINFSQVLQTALKEKLNIEV